MKPKDQPEIYDDSCLHLEHKRYFVTAKGKALPLTKTEFRILSRLLRGINSIVTFEDLWGYAWGTNKSLNLKSIHVFVSRVRLKLAPFGIRVDSVVGVGYILSHGTCCDAGVRRDGVSGETNSNVDANSA